MSTIDHLLDNPTDDIYEKISDEIEKNPKMVYKTLVKRNDSYSFAILAHMYQYNLINISFEKMDYFKKAYYNIYLSLYSSSADKAKLLYKKASEMGNSFAMNNLGYLYQKEHNYEEALKYYNMAIEKGNHTAMFNLGNMFLKLRDVYNIDYKTVVNLFERLINEKNDSEAMNSLGYMYKEGLGVEINYNKAKELYNKAIELGNITAMKNLAVMYLHRIHNEKKAFELFYKVYKITRNIDDIEIIEYNPKSTVILDKLEELEKENEKLKKENMELTMIPPQQVDCPECGHHLEIEIGTAVKDFKEDFHKLASNKE